MARELAEELAAVAESFFPRVGITRAVNYEDIQYLARQIGDCLIGEYENPGLAALIDQLAAKLTGGDLEMLRQRANMSADYITDIVCGLLGSSNRDPSCLQMVIEACADTTIASLEEAREFRILSAPIGSPSQTSLSVRWCGVTPSPAPRSARSRSSRARPR